MDMQTQLAGRTMIEHLLGELGALYAFVASRLGHDRGAAEDISQETMLAALQGAYEPDRGTLRAWLFGIALRKIVDHQRRRLSQDRLESVAREMAVRMVREPLPGEWLERHEVRAVVNEALARLPAATAVLLVRKYLDGASVAEIARDTGTTEKAVESQLTRARLAFHEVIQRFGDPQLEVGP